MNDQGLESIAHELATIARTMGLAEVAAEVESQVQRRMGDRKVRVVVLGETNHGKSSLINALVGRKLVPVGVTPTTQHVVTVRAGEDCGRYQIEAAPPKAGERHEIDESTFIDAIRGTKELEHANQRLEVVCEPGCLPERLELLDTPGFNDVDRLKEAVSRGELPGADVLLVVLDATQMLTKSELALLSRALEAVGGAQRSGVRVELVINRIDLVESKDRATLVDSIRAHLAGVIPGPIEPFLTDARRALKEPDFETADHRGVASLRKMLVELATDDGQLLPERAKGSLRTQCSLLTYSASIQARALGLEQSRLDTELEAALELESARELDRQEISKKIAQGGQKIASEMDDDLAKAREVLESDARDQLGTIDFKHLTHGFPGAIRDAFLTDARHHLQKLREQLDGLSREIMATHGNMVRRRLLEASLRLEFSGTELHVTPPSLGVEAGTIALGVVGTAVMYLGRTAMGLVMTIASPIATLLLRNKATREARAEIEAQLGPALDTSYGQLAANIRSTIEEHGRQLSEHIQLADAALARQLVQLLQHAKDRGDDEARRAACRVLVDIEARLEEISRELERPSPPPSQVSTASQNAANHGGMVH